MARFMVKASEFKNVCKAVNDRKLAELKKEIIEILKKQDEKDVKKAIDYFNSQEGHYTHLEKSLISGKWIQKAGYGVGTVRIWKGKKYKKIAPGKWARVFDKEGRGTNIAIGKLIARVQKIDNVEDLMAFVMENKQRFVDENGKELSIINKVRAAVDTRNEKLSGESSSYVYGVGKDVSRAKNEMFSKKDKITKEEAELHKVSRKISQVPTSELKQRKAKLDRWIENKTRNKRDSINNAIFKDSYKKEVDAINNELEKRSKETSKPAEKKVSKYGLPEKTYNELVTRLQDYKKIYPYGNLKETDDNFIRVFLTDHLSQDMNRFGESNELSPIIKVEDAAKEKGMSLGEFCAKILEEKNNNPAEKKTKTQEDYEKEYEQSLKGKNDAETLDNIVEAYDKVAKKLRPEAKAKGMNPNELNDPELEALGKLRLVYSEKNISEGEKKYREELEKLSGRMKDAINNEFGYKEESEAEKPSKKEETKETPKEEKTEKIYSVDNSGKVVSFDELQPIASNKSVGENEVQLPYSKDLANEIESLKDCVAPKYDNRDFLKHVYYENGKLVTTDARRMKFIDVGELEGIPDGSYVDITTDKSGINIKKIDLDAKFPNYKRVIPEDLNQKATLDTKLVKDKIKEMQKDGAISRKGTNLVQLEFRDGKVFIDDTPVGEAKDIKMKYGEGWGPANEETNLMAINADYLVNALSGKTSVLQIGERADKAVMINTGSSSNILMPMSGSDKKMDYGQGRQAKKDANEKKSALKEAYKKTNEEYIASIKANYGERFKRMAQSAADNLTERMADMSDETLKLNYDRLKFNLDKVMDKKEYITENTKVDNKLKLGLRDAILYQTTAKEHPEVIERFEEELEKRGITVKKSLFDDFVMDMFIDEDEEEIEEDKEDESLFNDYSAEQPELFNSTEMMVSEAFNRCNCL